LPEGVTSSPARAWGGHLVGDDLVAVLPIRKACFLDTDGFVDFRKASTVARRDEEGKEKQVEGGEYHDDWNSLQIPDEIVGTTSARGKRVLS